MPATSTIAPRLTTALAMYRTVFSSGVVAIALSAAEDQSTSPDADAP
jgi:hypothetical protein